MCHYRKSKENHSFSLLNPLTDDQMRCISLMSKNSSNYFSPKVSVNREQPIFSTKAHVFQIDPETKKKWLPLSTQAVIVSFYHDSTRGFYRIISIEGTKVLINSTVTPSMNFTKTSQKFGQWSDSRANTVYGLGFASETELTKFIDEFDEVKELSQTSDEASPQPVTQSQSNGLSMGDSSPRPAAGLQAVEQLRYENDRLKIALTQSSTNAKKWEVELQTLRNTNERLTAAIQESANNVDLWNKQLTSLKEENARLKMKMLDLEQSSSGSELVERQLKDALDKLSQAEQLANEKEKELNDYKSKVIDFQQLESQSQRLKLKIQLVEEENGQLRKDVIDLQQQLNQAKSSGSQNNKELQSLQQRLSTKINELYEMNDKLADLLQT